MHGDNPFPRVYCTVVLIVLYTGRIDRPYIKSTPASSVGQSQETTVPNLGFDYIVQTEPSFTVCTICPTRIDRILFSMGCFYAY